MQTIAKAIAGNAIVGDSLEVPWHVLDHELSLHTKELVIVAGAPGAGKSVFALNLLTQTKYSALYCAMDSAPSVYARVAAMGLGVEIEWAVESIRHPQRKHQMIDELADTYPDLFIASGAFTVGQIEDRIVALTEVLGEAPKWVVLDNLIDLIVPGHHHQDMGFYASALNELKQMSMRHNCCVVALHHVTRRGGQSGDPHGLGTRALKMTDLLYSGEREAEHVLGVYHSVDKDKLHIQILKQRDGVADPEGGLSVPLRWHPPLGTLGRA